MSQWLKKIDKIFVMIKYYFTNIFRYSKFHCFLGNKYFKVPFVHSFLRAFVLLAGSRLITFILVPFWRIEKSTPPSFCFSPLCLHEKSVIFLLDSTCRYSFHKCRLEEAGDTLEIEDFSSSSFRGTCSSLPESSIWSLKIADRVGREILLVKGW